MNIDKLFPGKYLKGEDLAGKFSKRALWSPQHRQGYCDAANEVPAVVIRSNEGK
jgi:hypothetical protein